MLRSLVGSEMCIRDRYWTRGMIGWKVDERILTDYIERQLPGVFNHITSMGIQPGMVFTPWLQTLFVSHLPASTVVRLWDCMLGSAVHFLHAVAIAAFRRKSTQLLETRGACEVIKLFSQPFDPDNLDQVLEEALALESSVKEYFLQARELVYPEVVEAARDLHESHYKSAFDYTEPPIDDNAQDLQEMAEHRRSVRHSRLSGKAKSSPPPSPRSGQVARSWHWPT
eukprot:TRINITY_DN60465_c0_g1_i2.p1 TRINITY_DN60465_c0_g1~~TRINITY_DN60465_c0_g1_i2.p1  ORF type:complete len:226 (+),score=41.32 TRINITY_DN60465_c0_g1_i2:77-754(+)